MQREQGDVNFFKSCVAYAPGWGMLGTTIGLIQMFSAKIDAASGFGPILNGLAVAFTTTLYGLFFMNFVFQPIVDKIKQRTEEEVLMKSMIVDGLCMIREKNIQFIFKINFHHLCLVNDRLVYQKLHNYQLKK